MSGLEKPAIERIASALESIADDMEAIREQLSDFRELSELLKQCFSANLSGSKHSDPVRALRTLPVVD